MHEALWAGIDLKIEHAAFHFMQMARAVEPPRWTAQEVAMQAAGTIVDTGWQRKIYPHLDAFLVTTRSVSELIKCCFGADKGHPAIKAWFRLLDPAEQARRQAFHDEFKSTSDAFRGLALSQARDVVAHRKGVADVRVTINTMFGVTCVGGPTNPVPASVIRPAAAGEVAARVPEPLWSDFTIDGQPLFQAAQAYLESARELVRVARDLASKVHGNLPLTSPPG
ncbi:MAG TPA: hypothetical protein VF169_18195 [Albitalea sp.]|uniref:hypothetical protein n=1 Tax=Piscinibacter sp. TaxID=1903157 RepID=UPI002ED4436D